ncbi:unnamed protein product [Leptidea sinapis]|uniref:Uncharacterized protein n=1 Tax=Leptidea sinapis TaxID=189913 RepID=A0A5E4QGX9_9NEOP|nr:unnamed protein product [Leptidea sinapis]
MGLICRSSRSRPGACCTASTHAGPTTACRAAAARRPCCGSCRSCGARRRPPPRNWVMLGLATVEDLLL